VTETSAICRQFKRTISGFSTIAEKQRIICDEMY